jgi:DNA-directed RNA polymerase specialized sigma24 family protein
MIAGTILARPISSRKEQENATFQRWLAAGETDRVVLEIELKDLIEGHARAVVYSVLRRTDEAVVADSTSRVLLNLREFQGEGLFTTWVHKIILASCYSQRRIERQRKEISMEIPGFDLPGNMTPDSVDMLLTVEKLLSQEQQDIFEMLAIQGFTLEEAAPKLRTTRSTLGRRWEEIRTVLQHAFAK